MNMADVWKVGKVLTENQEQEQGRCVEGRQGTYTKKKIKAGACGK
jgi:hypothetical protein